MSSVTPLTHDMRAPQSHHDNVTISVFRLLLVYRLMCQSPAISLNALNKAMMNHPAIQRHLTHETLGHYLNTLQQFGCQITRFVEGGEAFYRLGDHPLKPSIQPDEQYPLTYLCTKVGQNPLIQLSQRIYFLIQLVSSHCNLPFYHRDGSFVDTDRMADLSADRIALLERCVTFCVEGQVLEVQLRRTATEEETVLFEPIEVVFRRGILLLQGIDTQTRKKRHLPIHGIQSVKQLPHRARFYSMKTAVTFKVTGRLANHYRLYPGETLEMLEDGILIRHQTDDVEQLLQRLMKYGQQCEVLEPLHAREAMKDRVNQLLAAMSTH